MLLGEAAGAMLCILQQASSKVKYSGSGNILCSQARGCGVTGNDYHVLQLLPFQRHNHVSLGSRVCRLMKIGSALYFRNALS